jgi:hypothetical protein
MGVHASCSSLFSAANVWLHLLAPVSANCRAGVDIMADQQGDPFRSTGTTHVDPNHCRPLESLQSAVPGPARNAEWLQQCHGQRCGIGASHITEVDHHKPHRQRIV